MGETIKYIKNLLANKNRGKGPTLDDMNKSDADNLDHLYSKTHLVEFDNISQALQWTGVAMFACLKRVGIDFDKIFIAKLNQHPSLTHNDLINSGIVDAAVKKLMDEKNVQVEPRHDLYGDDEAWRRGNYIMKDGEIAYFIGSPTRSRIWKPFNQWSIRTNINFDIGNKRFEMMDKDKPEHIKAALNIH